MLSDQGIDLLIEFTNKTGATIANVVLTEEDNLRLDRALKKWDKSPTKENEQRIIDKFATDTLHGTEDRRVL